MDVSCLDNKRSYSSSLKKKLSNIDGICSRWQIALIPVVSSKQYDLLKRGWHIYRKQNRYIYTHTSPLIPQVAHVCLTLHGQRCIRYENIFTSCRRHPQDIPRSPHPRCAIVASRTIDTQSLPHDRDSPQAILVLRG
jgi:hypothetical protein